MRFDSSSRLLLRQESLAHSELLGVMVWCPGISSSLGSKVGLRVSCLANFRCSPIAAPAATVESGDPEAVVSSPPLESEKVLNPESVELGSEYLFPIEE